jgi:alcohol dehydrogenase (cytochrome c)
MTNGAYGTPLAGEYFKTKWSRRSVRAFYDRARTTMPPSQPGSLPADTYANIVAYILQVNGFKTGKAPLKAIGESLDKMVLE